VEKKDLTPFSETGRKKRPNSISVFMKPVVNRSNGVGMSKKYVYMFFEALSDRNDQKNI